VLNDLAVALTRFAQQHDNPSALIDAFVAVDSAVRRDSTLVEARFTRALLLEKLYLRTDAIAAWNHYLELDRRSRWADEAREHIAALRPKVGTVKSAQERLRSAVAAKDSQAIRSVIAESPSDIRVMVHDELAAWGDAFAHGDSSGARSHLDFARIVADRFRTETGDAILSDAVAVIDRALSNKDSVSARALADGHVALATAIRDLDGGNSGRGIVEMRDAHRLLLSGGSPMSHWALLYVARASHDTEAMEYLTAMRDSTPKRYVGVRSIAASNLGLRYDTHSDLLHVLPAYDTALTENLATREPSVALRVGSWLALGQGVLRGKDVGWRTQYRTLAASLRYPTKYQALVTVFDYGARATENDAPRLALLYSGEAVRVADRASVPTAVYMRRHRAELFARLGQIADAQRDIDSAKALVRSGNTSKNVQADLLLADAHIALYSAPAAVEPKILEVIDQFKASKYDKGLPAAYLYLAQSRGAAGAIATARAAFDSATMLMERRRATLSSYAERSALLDAMRSVVDLTVAFHAEHDSTEAFEFFESTRSRVLLEQLADAGAPEVTDHRPVLGALRSRLGKNDVVLSYAVLPKELLIWTVTRDGLTQHRVRVSSSQLEDLVQQFRESLRFNIAPSGDSSASARLYRLLVDAAGAIRRDANLIVIPDQWLHYVPFAALRDASTGNYLIRDHSLSYEPSATLLLSKLAGSPQRFSRASRVLAIGNPEFDQRTFQLQRLPAAKGEADTIAALYANKALTGRDATDSAFQRMSPGFDILHFAGHAIVEQNAPQLSHLVLAPQGRSDGAVFSSEIAQWKLPRTRLVVLSGCSTADGKLSATEGASSLARAFFAAGVPAVVSSFWEIDDGDTADFFVAFHRRLVNRVSPADALRETQNEWLGSGRPVRSWTAFQLFGR